MSSTRAGKTEFMPPWICSPPEAVPSVAGLAGRPRKRPAKLHADKAYASRAHRAWLRSRGIAPRIVRYGIESRDRLGKWQRMELLNFP